VHCLSAFAPGNCIQPRNFVPIPESIQQDRSAQVSAEIRLLQRRQLLLE
jgi:hypothetical protein